MSDKNNEIPKNVSEFLFRSSEAYGNLKNEEFSQFMWSQCSEISSPIEQLFFVAINIVSEMNYVTPSIATGFHDGSDDLQIIPQWNTGRYRVDFALRRHPIDKIICVELDGHDFHDRDEKQRRYEKTRDRFLVASGYSVLHYTGSEIVKDPCSAAIEVFKMVHGHAANYADILHPFEVF